MLKLGPASPPVELQSIFGSLIWGCGVGLSICDTEGYFLHANPAYCQITGFSLDQLRQRSRFDLIHPDDLETVKANLAACLSAQTPSVQFEKRYRRPDGSIRWVKTNASLAPGPPPLLLMVTEDVTAQRLAEQETRLLALALANSNDAVLITDAQLAAPGPHIVYANPAFTAMTGYATHEVLGRSPRILQGLDTSPTVLQTLRDCLRSGTNFVGEAINYRKDGSPYSVAWNVSPLHDDNGKIDRRTWRRYPFSVERHGAALRGARGIPGTLLPGRTLLESGEAPP